MAKTRARTIENQHGVLGNVALALVKDLIEAGDLSAARAIQGEALAAAEAAEQSDARDKQKAALRSLDELIG